MIISEKSIELHIEDDILIARKVARQEMADIGFGSADQTRMATAISELTRNVIKYAGHGVCHIITESTPSEIVIKVEIEDYGPGIDDINKAMEDGYTTGGGLGAGLPGAKRLVNDLSIESRPGLTKINLEMTRPNV
ncbi:ATP-binding protein [Methanolobus vulcani]|uniref:Anti-sigma regulatory factor n=1 Tax=Methanolobus vulcani TaxID=38026 RepID=A0A7Z8KN86_9EURY|nr:ATP-binding protein [Methanolobus vulcani]TQD24879.1 anti-sigma regulatory factor [Methanolobus vulcani]